MRGDLVGYRAKLSERFIKDRGILGAGGLHEIRILNRVMTYHPAKPGCLEMHGLKASSKTKATPWDKAAFLARHPLTGPLLDEKRRVAFRSNCMRCLYLVLVRPDIKFTAKEISRVMASPTIHSDETVKALSRYLAGHPRVLSRYPSKNDSQELIGNLPHSGKISYHASRGERLSSRCRDQSGQPRRHHVWTGEDRRLGLALPILVDRARDSRGDGTPRLGGVDEFYDHHPKSATVISDICTGQVHILHRELYRVVFSKVFRHFQEARPTGRSPFRINSCIFVFFVSNRFLIWTAFPSHADHKHSDISKLERVFFFFSKKKSWKFSAVRVFLRGGRLSPQTFARQRFASRRSNTISVVINAMMPRRLSQSIFKTKTKDRTVA